MQIRDLDALMESDETILLDTNAFYKFAPSPRHMDYNDCIHALHDCISPREAETIIGLEQHYQVKLAQLLVRRNTLVLPEVEDELRESIHARIHSAQAQSKRKLRPELRELLESVTLANIQSQRNRHTAQHERKYKPQHPETHRAMAILISEFDKVYGFEEDTLKRTRRLGHDTPQIKIHERYGLSTDMLIVSTAVYHSIFEREPVIIFSHDKALAWEFESVYRVIGYNLGLIHTPPFCRLERYPISFMGDQFDGTMHQFGMQLTSTHIKRVRHKTNVALPFAVYEKIVHLAEAWYAEVTAQSSLATQFDVEHAQCAAIEDRLTRLQENAVTRHPHPISLSPSSSSS